jgi:A/G-specific adenine glycosylase
MMELGATLCTPRRPSCEICPLQAHCVAAAQGDPERFPRPRPVEAPVKVRRTVLVDERQGRVLLFRREDRRRVLAGTWELPFADDIDGDEALLAALVARYGGTWELGPICGRARHSITRRAFAVVVRSARRAAPDDEVAEGPKARWCRRGELGRLPLSSLVEKALAARDRGVS